MSRSDVLVGRQPIFGWDREVVGYELQFQTEDVSAETSGGDAAAGDGGDLLTSRVLLSSLHAGLDRFVGDKTMFCDVSEELLSGDLALLLRPERCVLEVPAGALVGASDGAVVDGCRRLAADGYTLALDGLHRFSGPDELLELFAYVKTESADGDGVADAVRRCQPFGAQLVVQGVDTAEDFDAHLEHGADLFQGYLLATPHAVPGRVLDPGQLAKTRLAAKLLEPESDIAEVEALVRADPALSLQLLHVAGIGAPGRTKRTVNTVGEAVVLVGWRRLQAWVSCLLLSGGDGVSEETMTTALIRARMCELLGRRLPGGSSEIAFTAGMLSGLDILLGMQLKDIVRDLPLDDEVRDAILRHTGPLGFLVADVIDYQLGKPDEANRCGFDALSLQSACFDALGWAIETTTGLNAANLA